MKHSNSKRILSLVLMFFMVVSMIVPSYAALPGILPGGLLGDYYQQAAGTQNSTLPGLSDVMQNITNTFYSQFDPLGTFAATNANATTYAMANTAKASTSGTTYVLAGSDFQASSDSAGTTIVNGLIDKIKVDYPTMDGFLFAGDYSVNATKSTNVAALKNTILNAGLGLTENDLVLIQGNHDNSSEYSGAEAGLVGSVLNSSGANDAENYGVFVINEKDYMWHNDDEATIKKTAENLEVYLNAKRNAGYTKPIFVVSHLPLHYCMRTRNDGDGMYANYIFDVLNEAGNAGLNIIFMFGHNHSHGWDDYLGGAAIFLTKDDKINIAQSSKTNFVSETLAFTYMNAGYVGYYGTSYTSTVDKTLTMTTFAITDTDVTISRYDSNGTHNLKSAGVYNVEYPDSAHYSTDATTVGTPYTLTLNTEITPAGEEVEAPESGTTTTERTYTRVTSTSELVSGGKYLIIHNGQNDFMIPVVTSDRGTRIGYDLVTGPSGLGNDTITGNYQEYEWTFASTSGGWKIGSEGGYMTLQAADSRVAAQLTSDGDTMVIGGSENEFTFTSATYGNGSYVLNYNETGDLINGYANGAAPFYIYRMTNEGSGSSVDTTGGDWVTITEPTEAGTKYVYALDTDGVDTGVEYLIVANSYPKALSAAASSNNAVDIEIDGNYAYADSDTYGWTFTRYSNGVYYIRLNGITYLRLNDDALGSSNSTGSSRRWTVTSNGDGSYDIVRSGYNLRWSNSNGVFQASNSSEGPVRLYKYVRTDTIAAQDGLYGKISGELTYNVAIGTSAEDALAKVKAGIDILYHTGDANTAQTFLDDGEGMTWTLDPSYDGSTPGEYAVTIAYNGVTLGVAKVVVPSVNITGYTVEPAEGTVNKGASQAAQTGALIYVQLENGKYYTVPVTVAMLTKADGSAVSTGEAGTFENLKLTYNGVTITETFTLNVVAKTGNDYPEYPDEGAVKVNKTAIYKDEEFRKTGVAQVELSVSGVPVKKGADVIVMLDLSGSMTNNVGGQTRLAVLKASLRNLMTQLQANGEDGQPMDIRIAVADFNRYYTDSSSPYYINSSDHPTGGSIRTNTGGANQVYTGSKALDANAFVSVHDLATNAFDGLTTQSGTNYDYAFDAVYQLGEAINTRNAADGTERDLFVIFMSDGAPFQFNYFSSQSDGTGAGYWNNWLQGTMTDAMFANGSNKSYYNEDGKHWMAEAIKGDPASTYPVIRKNNAADTDGDNWVNVNGLGAKMYSIGFCLEVDKNITVTSMDTVIRNLATSEQYYFRADSAAHLNNAFSAIGKDIAYAASNARFVDQMGSAFNLQMTSSVTRTVDGEEIKLSLTPTIEVKSYDIYTKAEADEIPEGTEGDTVTNSMIGVRKGTFELLEVIMFSDDGKQAYSNQIDVDKDGIFGVTVNSDGAYTLSDTDDNILSADGLIYAKTFLYNTGDVAVTAEDTTITVDPETFYWKVGTVITSELAISYYVYLTDTMEGEREAGSYATNNFAVLYYDNYLGNACQISVASPMLPWKAANVSYAFYLVNEDGEVIVNQSTGQTGTFANKIAVTEPVVFEYIELNNTVTVPVIDVSQSEVLPDGYTIYDSSAVYKVMILSVDSTPAGWTITQGKDPATTYVTGYNGSMYSNALTNDSSANDYTHTTVWFAVVWEPTTVPDSVVVDYGLPVDINVLANDVRVNSGTLTGIGTIKNTPVDLTVHNAYKTAHDSDFGNSLTLNYGNAEIKDGKVRYTPTTMAMSGYDEFAYEVKYDYVDNSAITTQYYYGKVTVIPATNIYYEESFVTFNPSKVKSYVLDNDGNATSTVKTNADDKELGTWYSSVSDQVSGATQAEDRPGEFSLSQMDANNVYGFDDINSSFTKYSLGTAQKVTVDATTGSSTNAPEANFTFTGTGFDVISMTDYDSGVIVVTVTNNTTGAKIVRAVDNYYGYSYKDTDDDGVKEWVVDTASTDIIWQVPVIKFSDLDYGTYNVKIQVAYMSSMDHREDGSYSFWLDSIRIYDPAGSNLGSGSVIGGAYIADGEAYPQYKTLKQYILAAGDADTAVDGVQINGAVFIDGNDETSLADDYNNPGPNNETYLANGQSIAFRLKSNSAVHPNQIQIGAKLAYGTSAKLMLNDAEFKPLSTATDMYYRMDKISWDPVKNEDGVVTHYLSEPITLSNVSDSNTVISLTNVKVTYPEDPKGEITNVGTAAANYSRSYSAMSTSNASAAVTASEEELLTFVVDADTLAYAADVVTKLFAKPALPSVFAPATFKYSLASNNFWYFKADTLTVVTSTDVANVTANGQNMFQITFISELYRMLGTLTEKLGIDAAAILNGQYKVWTYTTSLAPTEVSKYEIIAYNDAGLASAPVNAPDEDGNMSTITREDIANAINRTEIWNIMKQLAARVFNPERFELNLNWMPDGKSSVAVSTSEDVEYVVANGEIINRYITETVVDLSKDGEKTVSRIWVADVDENVEKVEVTAYDHSGIPSQARSRRGHN